VHGPFLFISSMLQLIISSIFGCTCVHSISLNILELTGVDMCELSILMLIKNCV
jgi:hypothetical protein